MVVAFPLQLVGQRKPTAVAVVAVQLKGSTTRRVLVLTVVGTGLENQPGALARQIEAAAVAVRAIGITFGGLVVLVVVAL